MLSDVRIAQCECIFVLIDNNILPDEMLNNLMNRLMNNEYECYVYIMWLLTRWVVLRHDKFDLPTHKRNDAYCTNCGFSILKNHKYCGNCGEEKYERLISISDKIM